MITHSRGRFRFAALFFFVALTLANTLSDYKDGIAQTD
jgi:hypothetical protein